MVVLHYVLARLPRMQRGAWPQNRGAWPGLGRGLARGLAGLGRGLQRAWRGLVQALNEDFLNLGRGFALDFRLRRPGCLFWPTMLHLTHSVLQKVLCTGLARCLDRAWTEPGQGLGRGLVRAWTGFGWG